MKIRTVVSAALAYGTLTAWPITAPAQTCSSQNGTVAVNELLAGLTPVLNTAWPSLAVNTGLDPMTDVWEGSVNIGCNNGGDYICGLQLASCKKMYAEVDVASINGLAYLQFQDLKMTSVNAAGGTQACPYSSSASGGTYSCSYSGQGTGSAYFTGKSEISAHLSKIKVKVKCDSYFSGDFTETVFSGSATCHGSEPTGSASFNLCAGSCQAGQPPAVLSYGAMQGLDIKLGKVSCDIAPSYNPANWISDILVPKIEDDIIEAVTPTISEALNDLLAQYLPYPSKCSL